jgi:hypothetical protein
LLNKQENKIDRNYLVIPYTLSDYHIEINTCVLVDCGCTGLSVMSDTFRCQYNFPHYQLKHPKTIEVIDGRPISSSEITEYVEVQCTIIGDYYETLTTYLTSLGHYPYVLGIPWLKRHDININFAKMNS